MERTVYEIVASPMYGWNFKNSESRHVIKYAVDKKEIVKFAVEFCKTHNSELIIYGNIHERKEILKFKVTGRTKERKEVFL